MDGRGNYGEIKPTGPVWQCVVFRLEEQRYALHLSQIERVVSISNSEPLARAQPDRAALPAEDLLEKARPDAASLLQRARDLADQGQLDEAHRLCELARARNQLDSEAHLLLAAICQERGEVGTAVEALRRAIYLDQDSAPAHFLLGSLLLRGSAAAEASDIHTRLTCGPDGAKVSATV